MVKSKEKIVHHKMHVHSFCPLDNFRYGNSKEHMTVDELKLFLETEQKVRSQLYGYWLSTTDYTWKFAFQTKRKVAAHV